MPFSVKTLGGFQFVWIPDFFEGAAAAAGCNLHVGLDRFGTRGVSLLPLVIS